MFSSSLVLTETQICPEDSPSPVIPTLWLFPSHSFLLQSQKVAPTSLPFANQGLAHCRNSTKTVLEHMTALNSFPSGQKKGPGASEPAPWLQLIGLSHAPPWTGAIGFLSGTLGETPICNVEPSWEVMRILGCVDYHLDAVLCKQMNEQRDALWRKKEAEAN